MGGGIIAFRNLRGAVHQSSRRYLLDVARGDNWIAVAGRDDFALLGEFEAAIDRARGLGQYRAVCGASPASQCAASTVEEGEFDVVALGPLRDFFLRFV